MVGACLPSTLCLISSVGWNKETLKAIKDKMAETVASVRRGEQDGRGWLGEQNYSVWNYHGGYRCQNPAEKMVTTLCQCSLGDYNEHALLAQLGGRGEGFEGMSCKLGIH